MAAHRAKRECRACGAPVEGKDDLCPRCAGAQTVPLDAAPRVATQVRDRLAGGRTGDFVCPYCRSDLTWETLGALETEVTIYVREKIYYCPRCRAFLGVSSWHTEG